MKKIFLMILIMTLEMLHADKYAGEIFQLGAGVKNMAMGNTGLTDIDSPAIAYWNASLLEKTDQQLIDFMHAEEYKGLLKYDAMSAVWGTKSKFAMVLTRIGINDIPLTKLEDEDQEIGENNKPYEYKSVNNSDWVLYFGLSRSFSDKINIGLTPKFAYRMLAEESGYGFGADLSTHWNFTPKTMAALRIKDFFSTQVYWKNGTHETVSPSVDAEISQTLTFPINEEPIRLIAGVESRFDGEETASTNKLGSASFDLHAGLDLTLVKYAHLYAGYDKKYFTAGLSLHVSKFHVYYAFKNNTELDNSHRVSAAFNF